ncbi:hypothetical protein M0R19_03750 [Candidatus Pacearchaeota archaeon]|jgi:hypothetical protein|nr:hypothetical protein [Candidatus Pacearchaeota archaeon]
MILTGRMYIYHSNLYNYYSSFPTDDMYVSLYLEIDKNWFIKNILNLNYVRTHFVCSDCTTKRNKSNCFFLYRIKSKKFVCYPEDTKIKFELMKNTILDNI